MATKAKDVKQKSGAGNGASNKSQKGQAKSHGGARDTQELPALTYRAIEPAAMAALFGAAVGLYRVQPWRWVPVEESLFAVTSEALGLEEAALFLIGQEGMLPGFMLFDSADDFEEYLDCIEQLEAGEAASAPRHIALTFEHRKELEPELRQEINANGWEVRAADGYPILVAMDEKLVMRPPSSKDVAVAEALLVALSEALRDKAPFVAAWKEGSFVEQTLQVRTSKGEVEVSLRCPFELADGDLLDALEELEEDEEMDHAVRQELEDELISHFLESPEARELEQARFYRPLLDQLAYLHDATLASMQPHQLREVLFEVFPRKVLVPSREAESIIAEFRALFAYLKREFGWEQADACLEVLGSKAALELKAAFEA